MIRVATLIAVAAALVSCSALPTEQRLIGTWRMPVDQIEDEFGLIHRKSKMAENTLKPDHTYTSGDAAHRHAVTTGKWHLSGRWLTYEFPDRSSGRLVIERSRVRVVKLSERELIVKDERGRDGEWTKIR
jgi:hypothetical protein